MDVQAILKTLGSLTVKARHNEVWGGDLEGQRTHSGGHYHEVQD
jgi:hypothetical protein